MDDRFERALSPHANYDVAPDGTSLLVLDGAGSDRLIAVHNWADEVRAQLRSLTPGRQGR